MIGLYFTEIILVFTRIVSVQGSCEHCTTCQVNTCNTCTPGYNLTDSACVSCQDDCKDCYNATRCDTCNIELWLDANTGSCSACAANCSSCDSYTDCAEYTNGYYPDNGQCCPSTCTTCNCSSGGQCSSCEDGYWGPVCSKMCRSRCKTNRCTNLTGYCKECNVGCWGPWCVYSCITHCLNNICSQSETCRDGCRTGFLGISCTNECQPNCKTNKCDSDGRCSSECKARYYGDTCELKCSGTACVNNECFQTNGTCMVSCPDKCSSYSSMFACTACNSGYFGTECEYECSNNCALTNGVLRCNKTTGACRKCKPGCYGIQCTAYCSDGCGMDENGTRMCAKTDGTCNRGCIEGYHGTTCTQAEKSSTAIPIAAVVGVGAVLLIIIVIVVVCIVKRRSAAKESPSGQNSSAMKDDNARHGDRVELSKSDERTGDDGSEYSDNPIYVPLTETQVAAMGLTPDHDLEAYYTVTNEYKYAADRCSDSFIEHYTTIEDLKLTNSRNTTTEDHYALAVDRNPNTQLDKGDRVELSKGDERTEDDGAEYSNNSIYVPLTETQVAAMGLAPDHDLEAHYTVTNEQKSAIDRCSDGFEEHNTTVSDLKSTNSRVTNEQKSAADRCSDGFEEHYTTIKDFKLTTSRNTTTEDHYAPADDRNFNTQLDIGDRVELSKGDERTEDDGAEYSNNSIYVPLTETQVAAMGLAPDHDLEAHYTVTNEQKSAIDRCSDAFEEHNTTVSDLKSTNSRVTNEQKSAADRCSDGFEEHYTTIKDFKLTTSRNTTTEDHYAPADDRNFNTQLDIGDRVELSKGNERTGDDGFEYSDNPIYVPLTETQVAAMGLARDHDLEAHYTVTNEQKSAADRCNDSFIEHYTTIKDLKSTTSRNTTTEDHYALADDRNSGTQLDIDPDAVYALPNKKKHHENAEAVYKMPSKPRKIKK